MEKNKRISKINLADNRLILLIAVLLVIVAQIILPRAEKKTQSTVVFSEKQDVLEEVHNLPTHERDSILENLFFLEK